MSKRDDIEWGGIDLTYNESLRRHEERQRQSREERRSAAPAEDDEITDPIVRAFRWLADNIEIVHVEEGR